MGRLNVTRAFLSDLEATLTTRDRDIIATVGRFKLAGGDQLERLFFAHCSQRSRARDRQAVLKRLVDRQVLAVVGKRRVGGEGGGSSGTVYALDVAGQRLAELTNLRPRRPYTHYEPTMGHYLAVTELYVQLVEAERAGKLTLLAFEAEPYCWRRFDGGTLKPDAFVQIGVEADGQRRKRSCFIEVDRGDQWGAKIASKLPRYLTYQEYDRPSGRVFPLVLFLAPDERRVGYLEQLILERGGGSMVFRAGLFERALLRITDH